MDSFISQSCGSEVVGGGDECDSSIFLNPQIFSNASNNNSKAPPLGDKRELHATDTNGQEKLTTTTTSASAVAAVVAAHDLDLDMFNHHD